MEIKTPWANLLWNEYRPECRICGKDVIWGIAQIQTTIHKFKKENYEKLDQEDSTWNKTWVVVYSHKPKSVLVVWDLSQFKNEHWTNEKQHTCFQLFRESIDGVETITFDELFKRAESIIECSSSKILPHEKAIPTIEDIISDL